MGNSSSSSIKQPHPFGKVYAKEGEKTRPGYYFTAGKIIYAGVEVALLPDERDFMKLNYGYLKTNRRVLYKGVSILPANPFTFSIIGRKNVNSISKYPEKNEAFVKLNSVLGVDYDGNTKRVYFKDRVIHQE